MLLQQAAQLVEAQIVPPDSIKILISKMAELLDFPDIADGIKKYQPQPSPMEQIQLQKEMAEAKKSDALAQNAIARTKQVMVKTQKEAASTEAELTEKYAKALKDMNAGKNEKTSK